MQALYHPPLYVYSLAGWFAIFGDSPASARLFSALCALIGSSIVLFGISYVTSRRSAIRLLPYYLAFFFLTPYGLQVFSIADIDVSILMITIPAALFVAIRIAFVPIDERGTLSILDVLTIAFVLFLNLAAKLTTPLLLPLVIAAILSLRFSISRSILITALATILGAALFLIVYYLFGYLTGLRIAYTSEFLWQTIASKAAAGNLGTKAGLYFERIMRNVASIFDWGIAPTILAAAIFFVVALKQAFDSAESFRKLPLLGCYIVSFALSIIFAYSLITSPFGYAPNKYIAPAWPLISAAAAFLVMNVLEKCNLNRASMIYLMVVTSACFFVGMFVIKDRALLHQSSYIWTDYAMPAGLSVILSVSYLLFIPNGLFSKRNFILAALALSFLGSETGRAVAQVRTHYAKQYNYGQSGFEQTLAYIRLNTKTNDVIVSMKDIGYAVPRRYIESYGYLYTSGQADDLFKQMNRLNVRLLIFTENRGEDQLEVNPAIRKRIIESSERVASFGNYVIYRRTLPE